MKEIVNVLVGATMLCSAGPARAGEDDFVARLHAFDRAQEQLDYAKVAPFLAQDVSMAITTCENAIERFDRDVFRESYLLIQKNADTLEIQRKVTGIEDCDDGRRCTVRSSLSERLVGFAGRYDKTTISSEVAQLTREDGSIKIRAIRGVIRCD